MASETAVSKKRGRPPAQVVDSARLNEDLGAQRIDRESLRMELEEKFEIEIPDEEEARLSSVCDVIRHVAEAACR